MKKLKENYDINVKLIHFPLHPETPQEGRTLMDLFSSGPEEIQIKNMRMHGLMEADGLRLKTAATHIIAASPKKLAHGLIPSLAAKRSMISFMRLILLTVETLTTSMSSWMS